MTGSTRLRVVWEKDTVEPGTPAQESVSYIYVPNSVLAAHEAEDYDEPIVEDHLSDTFGWLVKEWEVAE